MSKITTNESLAIAASQLVMNHDAMANLMRMAETMATGRCTVPKHLQGSASDCMAVAMQAMQWGMNPFAVAQKTHIVNGTLGYEAQLVNAVVQSTNAIDGSFKYEFRGNNGAIECRVGAVIRGEREITWGEWLNEAKVTTKNSPLWKTNPRQQMGYLQVKNWARLYAPGAILGVYTPDELEISQPRNMGAAQEVAAPAIDAGLLEAAQNAASEGVASYSAFWKKASPETRKAIGKDEHNRLKDVATAADAARTVDQPEPVAAKGFDEILSMLCAAQNIDALYVAGEWIHTIEDLNDQNVLAAKFDEMKAELEPAQ